LATLPETKLPWLSLRDHFVATVGARAGTGRPLGSLLVLADATFAAGSRFPLHPHQEMEILSVVVTGTLSHHGDQAHGAQVPARQAQLISARSGIVHAEGNDTASPVRMLQLWFQPDTHGGAPAYFSTSWPTPGRHVIASGDGQGMPLRCAARVEWIDVHERGEPLTVAAGRTGYLMALTASLELGGTRIAPGEGVVIDSGVVAVRAAAPGAALFVEV